MDMKNVTCVVLTVLVLALLYKLFASKESYAAVCTKGGLLTKSKCNYCGIPVKEGKNVKIDFKDRDALLACDNFKRDCKNWFLSIPGNKERDFDASRDCMPSANKWI